jgi:chromosome segregation ATPase
LDAIRTNLAEAQKKLREMQSKYQVQAYLISLLAHSSIEQRKEKKMIVEEKKKLRKSEDEYKKKLEKIEDENIAFKQYIEDVHHHVSIMEEDIEELKEQNELLQDQLALPSLDLSQMR